jgi:hypothetical protein
MAAKKTPKRTTSPRKTGGATVSGAKPRSRKKKAAGAATRVARGKKTAKRKPERRASAGTPAVPGAAKVARRIESEAQDVRRKILAKKTPSMKFPVRSLSNVVYRPAKGYFQMRGKKKERTLTVGTVKTFAQTLRMMAFSKELVETDDIATKREAYYVSKNWEECRFSEQPESDTVMEDVELGRVSLQRAAGKRHGHGGRGSALRGESRTAGVHSRGEGR